MGKIKLVIADDESSIRNAISRLIDWAAEEIEVVGIAKDGKEALDIIRETQADIALLDIQMPLMTGLEVVAEMKRDKRNTKAILLTGYDDFSYAREALVQGAVNYLLKPCRPEEIFAAVVEIKQRILIERESVARVNENKAEVENSRYDVKNKKLADFILTTNEKMLAVCEEKIGYDLGEQGYCLVIKPSGPSVFFVKQQQFMIEYLEENLLCVAGCIAENIVVVMRDSIPCNKKRLRETLIKLKQLLSNKFALVVSVGVGNIVRRSDGLKPSFQNALKALDMIHFLGTDFVIFYDSIYATQSNEYPHKLENEIIEAIKQQDALLCKEKVDAFLTASLEKNGGNGTVKNSIAILLSLYHFTVTSGFQADVIFVRPLELMEDIQKSKSLEELSSKIKSQCTWIIEQMKVNVTENRFVNEAVRSIRKNFDKDITLSMVAEEVCITPGYLSTLFKQAMGDSFVNYLNRVRIEKACQLLKTVQLRTYEVAYKVGFQDEKYFTKVFKKIMGVSPSQYKKGL